MPTESDLVLEGSVRFPSLGEWAPLIAEISRSRGGQGVVYSTGAATSWSGADDNLTCKYAVVIKAPSKPDMYDVDVIVSQADAYAVTAKIRMFKRRESRIP